MLSLILLSSKCFSQSEVDNTTIQENNTHYRIVFDAGSSKTKLYLYKYQLNQEKVEQIQLLSESKVTPGLASTAYSDIPTYLDTLLTPELAETIQAITGHDHFKFTQASLDNIQFYSTAGMRQLPIDEQFSINKLVGQVITMWLKNNNIQVIDKLDVRTISGEEEGTYAWLAAHYLQQKSANGSFGIIELGGASAQLTYIDSNLANVVVKSENQQFYLTSKSAFLGQDLASVTLMAKDACNLPSYTETSSGDYFICREYAKQYIDSILQNSLLFAPNAINIYDYNLLSNFYYTADFFGLSSNYSLNNLQVEAEAYCTQDWKTVKEMNPNTSEAYLSKYCMSAAYQAALLVDTLQLSDTQNLVPIDSIATNEISWSIGVIITQRYLQFAD